MPRTPEARSTAVIGSLHIRLASDDDLESIRRIYNEGVDDRAATLETEPKSASDMADWWSGHDARYAVIVAEDAGRIVGWASLNRFSHRCAHSGIADLSVYVARDRRGHGIGAALLADLESRARRQGFHKIVLHALDSNEQGKRLYDRAGFAAVGVFKEHGMLDGAYVDVVAMEMIL